jgi:hypothetical protein
MLSGVRRGGAGDGHAPRKLILLGMDANPLCVTDLPRRSASIGGSTD